MPSPSDSPDVAIIIPLFKHSVLVADALESALQQRSRYSFVIVVVNDGCPFEESDLQIKSILAAYPGIIRYIFQKNSGLSAARNTGVDYALTHFPSIRAIYFMDADNTIHRATIETAFSKLLEEPQTSWVYPNLDMFGIKRNFDYSGAYSVLKHTQYNICEAGSLVHRRVFDAGIRFDEQMKLGYEDWDFWLTAAAKGFRGSQHAHFGFRYRNRGESMLSQSHRDNDEIMAYMLRKHQSLLGKRNLLRLESMEAPRYAIIFNDTNEVLLTCGEFDLSGVISLREFEERLWRNIISPTNQYIPPFFVLMTRALFDELSQLGLVLWVLHDSEVTLKEMNFACLVIERSQGQAIEVKSNGRGPDSDVLALGRELVCSILRDRETKWVEQLMSPSAEMKVLTKTVTVPRRAGFVPPPKGTVVAAFLFRIMLWRSSPYRAAASRSWIWREFSLPPPHSLYFNVRAAFDGEVVYPWSSTSSKNIGFVLPIVRFGGVERVAYNLAKQFAQAGWSVHLFAIGSSRIEIPREFSASIATINFLNDTAFGGWDLASSYQGTALPAARNSPRATNRIEAALAWLDVVVNCHSGEFNVAAANLRRLGVKTIAHLHLLDLSPHGRSVGHPIIALAYEYAYDLILSNSRQLTSWLHAAGIPREKLLQVPNAPGFQVEPATLEKIVARRKSSTPTHLNALYLGRLDRQKGIDRVADVIRRTRVLGLPITWRIVGAAVTDDDSVPPALTDLVEPAVFESDELTSLFEWADVMVLLSDYEGVPLSILEAQRCGVVVIATDVGALSEIISSGKTGFLIERENAVEETIEVLRLILEMPGLRSKIAGAASHIMEWPEAAAELLQRTTALVESKRRDPTDSGICNLRSSG